MGNAAKRGARAIERADQTKEAADLRRDGWALAEIAEHQHISASTVMRRLDAYCERHPMESIEKLRELSMRRTDRAMRVAMKELEADDVDVRLDAAKTVARLERIRADIAGIVKIAPPAIVTVSNTNVGIDTSKLAPEKLATLHALVSEAAIKADTKA